MRILIVGDSNSEIAVAVPIAQKMKSQVAFVSSENAAVERILNGESADILLVDVKYDIKGLISTLQSEHIVMDVISFGIHITPKAAAQSIKDGAKEFIPLPPDERLIAAVFASICGEKSQMICNAAVMRPVMRIADRIARSDAHILITGKSGTGKEVMAQYIHDNSSRTNNKFIKVNCAAIPDNLLESELFGHEKGAFTGALSRRIGKFEEASGGTLLLDEISEMDLRLQAKLLRAIQEQEIDRLGGNEAIKVNLRIIATSNRNLLQEISLGNFREDLYFRLNVINIHLPNLSERVEDIQDLAILFANKYAKSNEMDVVEIDNEAMEYMKQYPWPGNIRELENTIHRAVLMSQNNVITVADLGLNNSDEYNRVNIKQSDVQNLLLNTMRYCSGDMMHAANILGISINTLKEKLHAHTVS